MIPLIICTHSFNYRELFFITILLVLCVRTNQIANVEFNSVRRKLRFTVYRDLVVSTIDACKEIRISLYIPQLPS
jgi:hypothetical protein